MGVCHYGICHTCKQRVLLTKSEMWAEKFEQLGQLGDQIVDQSNRYRDAYAGLLQESTGVLGTLLTFYGLGVEILIPDHVPGTPRAEPTFLFFKSRKSFADRAMHRPKDIVKRLLEALRALRLYISHEYETDILDAAITLIEPIPQITGRHALPEGRS